MPVRLSVINRSYTCYRNRSFLCVMNSCSPGNLCKPLLIDQQIDLFAPNMNGNKLLDVKTFSLGFVIVVIFAIYTP